MSNYHAVCDFQLSRNDSSVYCKSRLSVQWWSDRIIWHFSRKLLDKLSFMRCDISLYGEETRLVSTRWSLFCKCRIYQVNLKHNWLFNTLIILYLSQTNKTDTRPSSDCIWIYITRISRFGVYLAVWPRCEGSFHTLLPLCFPTFLLGASNSSNFSRG